MTFQIGYLKHHTDFIPEIAHAFFVEWGHLAPGKPESSLVEALMQRTNVDQIPLAFVAFTDDGKWVGTAQLKEHDMEERKDLSPWFAGFYVKEEFRRLSVGQMLLEAVIAKTKDLGIRQLYLFTEKAESYYAKRGWTLREKVQRGEILLSVMEYSIAL